MNEFHQGADDPPHSAWLRANRYLEADRPTEAERACREGLTSAPDDVDLLVALSRSLCMQERWDEARDEAENGLRISPNNPRCLSLVGYALTNTGQNQEAEKMYLDALRVDPQDPNVLYLYAHLLFRTGHLDKADAVLRRSLAGDPEDARAHSLLSMILAEKKDRAAKHHGDQGLALEPDDDMSHYAKGIALFSSGHPFQARDHLREALRLDPSDGEEMFLEADRACRWTYLPMYHWFQLTDRLPGQQFFVWGMVLVFVFAVGPFAPRVVGAVVLFYIAFCLYTWIASPLTSIWIRFFPPK